MSTYALLHRNVVYGILIFSEKQTMIHTLQE